LLLSVAVLFFFLSRSDAQTRPAPKPRCIALELYLQSEQDDDFRRAVEEFVRDRAGASLRIYDLRQDDAYAARLDRICAYFKKPRQTPAVYGCGQLVLGGDAAQTTSKLQSLTTMEVFVRAGCPHCTQARSYLPTLLARYPGFTLRLREISRDAAANRDLQSLTSRHGVAAASVPVFHVCNQVLVVVTLQRRKMQETQGRWLKLISGGAILTLGCVMLVRPAWIGMGE
jgi:hypothetical protein